MNNLGKLIAKLRQEQNLTQDELANLIFCSRTYISYIENNERQITEQYIIPLSRVLNHDLTQYTKYSHEYKNVEHYILSHKLLNLLDLYKHEEIRQILEEESIIDEFEYGHPYILREYCKAQIQIFIYKNYSETEKIMLNLLEINSRDDIYQFKPLMYKEEKYYSCVLLLSTTLAFQGYYQESQALLETIINFLEINIFNSSLSKNHINLYYRKLYIAALNNNAEFFYKLENFDEALKFCNKALHVIIEYESSFILELVLKLKIEVLCTIGDTIEAQKTYATFKEICMLKGADKYLSDTNKLIKERFNLEFK